MPTPPTSATEAPPSAGVPINGAKVRELRQNAGEKLIAFAPRAGITYQYLSQIERGNKRTVSPPVFVRICDALGIDEADRDSLRVKT